MKIVFDLDGTITTNPDFFKLFIYFLKKKPNNNRVYILTARNPNRKFKTIKELKQFGINYDRLLFMPNDFARDFVTQAKWKKDMIVDIDPDIWFENDIKMYESLCGVSFKNLKVNIINI